MTKPVFIAAALRPAKKLTTGSWVSFLRIGVAIVLVGTGAGVGGALLALLLHAVQHVAYGYSEARVVSAESFLQGVTAASPLRRLLALAACGFVMGMGYWLLYRYGKALVSVRKAVDTLAPMPALSTPIHAMLQIVTVGLGSPLGREVAPREIGAALAGWVSRITRLSDMQTRVMVACGAGAGLAAVYNVPLGGAIFVLEVMLASFSWRVATPALISSGIASEVADLALGNEHQYAVPQLHIGASLIVWSILAGPLLGLAARAFTGLMDRAKRDASRDWRLVVLPVILFSGIGVLAMYFPQLPGNGKGPASLTFKNDLPIELAAVLLLLKVLIIAGALRVGGQGGLLTPSLACGALLASMLGAGWSALWAGPPEAGFAIVGAAAFLGASMKMPLTAIVLALEFTQVDLSFAAPMALCTAGAMAISMALDRAVPGRRD